jgi:hypothetical protein
LKRAAMPMTLSNIKRSAMPMTSCNTCNTDRTATT